MAKSLERIWIWHTGKLSFQMKFRFWEQRGNPFLEGLLSETSYTISHFRVLNRVVPGDILPLSFPLNLIILADFVCLIAWDAWSANLCTALIALNTVIRGPILNRVTKLLHFLLDRVAKFTSWCLELGQVSWVGRPKFLSSPLPGNQTSKARQHISANALNCFREEEFVRIYK